MSTNSCSRTAVAAPIQSRIGRAFKVSYTKIDAHPSCIRSRKGSPDGESVHIGARNRRHSIHAYLNGLVACARLCRRA